MDLLSGTMLLGALVLAALVAGRIAERLHQPRIGGEILAGWLLAQVVPAWLGPSGLATGATVDALLGLASTAGSILLMYFAGLEVRALANASDRRQVAGLSVLDFGLPVAVTIAVSAWIPLSVLRGPVHQDTALLLVVAVATAVTSVPVLSRIFHDLDILRTRFASVVLNSAVLGDTGLWVMLAIADALARSSGPMAETIATHLLFAGGFLLAGVTVLPQVLRKLALSAHNPLAKRWPGVFDLLVMLAYLGVAQAVGVNLAFGAFLAGLARPRVAELPAGMARVRAISFVTLIPAYFAVAGYHLDISRSPTLWLVVGGFLLLSSAVKVGASAVAARVTGFRGFEVVNLAITMNARGGPGIIVATAARDAGLVSAPFYSALVLTAVVTSVAAGSWLQFVLHRGWPLVRESVEAGRGR